MMDSAPPTPTPIRARQRWLGLLARAPVARLEAAWNALASPPDLVVIRAPETGLVMLRGRANGDGRPFNLGETTVTRASVRLDAPGAAPLLGHGYVSGRSTRHALLAASLDALLQRSPDPDRLAETLIDPLEVAERARDAAVAAKAAETKVDFLTLVRGDA